MTSCIYIDSDKILLFRLQNTICPFLVFSGIIPTIRCPRELLGGIPRSEQADKLPKGVILLEKHPICNPSKNTYCFPFPWEVTSAVSLPPLVKSQTHQSNRFRRISIFLHCTALCNIRRCKLTAAIFTLDFWPAPRRQVLLKSHVISSKSAETPCLAAKRKRTQSSGLDTALVLAGPKRKVHRQLVWISISVNSNTLSSLWSLFRFNTEKYK